MTLLTGCLFIYYPMNFPIFDFNQSHHVNWNAIGITANASLRSGLVWKIEEIQPTRSNVLDLAHLGEMPSHWEMGILWQALSVPGEWMRCSSSCEIHLGWHISYRKTGDPERARRTMRLISWSWVSVHMVAIPNLNCCPQSPISNWEPRSGYQFKVRNTKIQRCRGELSWEDWEKPFLSGLRGKASMPKWPKYCSWTSWLASGPDFQINSYLPRPYLP